KIDLHLHSNRSSDGEYSPSELVRMAHQLGLKAIAIADHDTVAAYPEALEAGRRLGLEVIPSVEITTIYREREFHLLLPFVDWASPTVKKLVKEVDFRRRQEAKERVRRLQQLGFDISWEEVEQATAPFPPLGVTIAQILLRKNNPHPDSRLLKYYQPERRAQAPYLFYRDYFMEGQPAYVPRQNISLLEVLELAPATGGVSVLAHPGAYFQKTTREDLAVFREKGLAGLEVYTSYHSPEETAHYEQLAQEFDLVPTTGSDFHGYYKPHVRLGQIQGIGYEAVIRLKQRRP
ncbi:PHP domain-containing protein, partial [Candidatus Aminicenantes bacterium AC-334-K16]|nr:PHP domain-containing protein [Candidatus Aminicenantes bacterium AC-334-K16]